MSHKKRDDERYVRACVTLPPDIADRLRREGQGNLSAGIREAVRKALKRTGDGK